MRVFVTGGGGFLGRHVVDRLRARGHDVVVLLRPRTSAGFRPDTSTSGTLGRIDVVLGALGRVDSYRDALGGCDAVCHMAADMRGPVSALFMTNVVATRALVEAARTAAVRRFVHVSSFGVYGTATLARGDTLDETCPLDPQPHRRDGYSYSKIAQELVIWDAHRGGGPAVVVIRPGVIYGPGRDWISSRLGLRAGNVLLKLGGRQVVPYTYVENCADAVCRAVDTDGIDGEAFNVVDDELPTANALLREHRRRVGRLRVIPVPAWAIGSVSALSEWYHEYSAGQMPAILTRYRSDAMWKPLRYTNAKAKRLLGWRPAIGFGEGLTRSVASLAG